MSNRPGPMPLDQQIELGVQIVAARGQGVSWKVLERVYNRGRLQLWRYAGAATAALGTQSLVSSPANETK
ncbi:MAG TPA: hypothetical protein VNT30_09325 [Stellaceae bacterium]|nr:hypothetical protein [Stellaceae bacterium]